MWVAFSPDRLEYFRKGSAIKAEGWENDEGAGYRIRLE